MKMTRHLFVAACAVVAAAGFGVSARAADAPSYEVRDYYQPSGFYAGLWGAWGWGDSIVSDIDPEVDGFIFGGLAGWELRRDGLLVGAEADIGWANIDGRNVADGTAVDMDWIASARLRLGFDGGLYTVYGTGGVAFARMEATVDALTPTSATSTLTGLAVGAGVEAMLTQSLAARVEYMYYTFDDEDFAIGTGEQADLRLHTVRGAIVYKFSM